MEGWAQTAHQILFVATGLLKTFGNQKLANGGITAWLLLVNVLCSVLGPVAIGLFMSLTRLRRLVPSRRERVVVFVGALLDCVGSLFQVAALALVGSGIFSLIYAALPTFTAILRFVFLGKGLSSLKILYMLVVLCGLAIVPVREGLKVGSDSVSTLHGIALSFGSTIVYAFLYVFLEKALQAEGLQVSCDPVNLMFWQGLIGAVLSVLGFGLWTMFFDWQLQPVALDGMVLVLIFVSSGVHGFGWIKLLEVSGSTGTGLLQGIRSSAALVLSGVLFCDSRHLSQCLDLYKILSVAVVTVFVFLFNRAK